MADKYYTARQGLSRAGDEG